MPAPKDEPPANPARQPADTVRANRPAAAEALLSQNPTATTPLGDQTTQSADPLAETTFQPGDLILGRFLIQSFISRGGMGEVYAALDQELHESVALKTVRADVAARWQAVESFAREVRQARKIRHPNFCRVYEFFAIEDHGRPIRFLTMELLDGQTLQQMLRERVRLTPEEALPLLEQMAAGLDAVHREGLAHCDFKPGNIFLVPERGGVSRVVVMDLGLAGRVDPVATVSVPPGDRPTGGGTLPYMAPEQWALRKVTKAADIYALGLVAYEMVTGRRPWPDKEASKRISEDPPEPKSLVPHLPSRWNRAIMRCLARDPAERPPSAPDAVHALRPRPRPWKEGLGIALAISVLGFFLPPGKPLWTSLMRALRNPYVASNPQFPALSPDGGRLAFASRQSGNWDIYVQDLATGSVQNLTAANALDDAEPAFSPDGKRLAFYSRRSWPGGSSTVVSGIFLLDFKTRALELLAADGHHPDWSPDGKEITFVDEGVESADERNMTRSRLSAVRVSGRAIRRIYDGDAVQATWSPDGRYIAFMGLTGGNRDIYTIPAGGGKPRLVTGDVSNDWSPAWSPDGRYLYFCSDRVRTMGLWRVLMEDLTASPLAQPEQVNMPGDYIGPIGISRSGKIAVVIDESQTNFYRIPFQPESGQAGEAQVLPVRSNWLLAAEQTLAPPADRFAFVTLRLQRDLFVAGFESNEPVRLTNDKAQDRSPSWSPDGAWIAFQSNRGGPYQVFAMHPDGSLITQVTSASQDAVNPIWSPDSTHIVYTLNQVALCRTPFHPGQTSTEVETLVDFGGPGHEFMIAKTWSMDGNKIAGVRLSRDGKTAGISTFDLKTRELRHITPVPFLSPVFLPGGRRLVCSRAEKLWLLDLSTGASTQIPTPEGVAVQKNVSVSPDGRWILFNQLDRKTSVRVVDLADLTSRLSR
ncbi:MAG: serine/threonine-protein kinase [Bryobacterales bacterium]|nr:serine/threonine-protein kinase [Bryobacterales bacterium]